MTIKVYYIADTNLENKSAYTQHVLKMCDAFSQNHCKLELLVPFSKKKSSNFLKKKYLLNAKKYFSINSIINKNILNFIDRLIFGLKAAVFTKNKDALILTRSIYSSFFLCIFKKYHYLEIHSEMKSLSKFLMIYLDFIKKKIVISNALNKIFGFDRANVMVLHDGTDTKNFKKTRIVNKIKVATYIGSFYKGRGIDLIFEIAKKFQDIKFNLYGFKNEIKIKNKLKNVRVYKFVDYNKVPKILNKSDVLLMPYYKQVSINAKNINTANYCSPLKMFDYLASGKIIISSKLDGICEVLRNKKNAIIVEDYKINLWEKVFNDLISNKFDNKKIRKNAILTAEKYSWYKRSNLIIKDYLNKT